ncbi:putative F-box/kelch-repeat protein [Cardamine amara subsp. amara]|uniref:F-box/kelch-repeat protein n=1 Tax=Cardamine amara subsp. amara TaxID=228776 RepID=A0ABD1BKG9_CARAN
MTFMMLPNDLVLNCLARVSRLYYPTLSLVSERFRYLLASTELYQTRILLGCTESCLYVCLKLRTYHNPQHWFTICRKPNSSKNVLVPIASPNSHPTYQSDFARVGSNIYAIGGFINDDNASSRVMVMDCRSRTWLEAPSIRIARATPSTCVLDGKIYVIGGCKNLDATNWIEVFDTKTQTWEFMSSSHGEKICSSCTYHSLGYDGDVYVKGFEKRVTYKLDKGRWRPADIAMDRGWFCSSSSCVMENVLYSWFCGMIRWYDSEENFWKYIKGLEGSDELYGLHGHFDAKMTGCGGKLVVMWEKNVYINECHYEKGLWCAEIALEKHQGDIWGTLEWSDVVSTTTQPYEYDLAHILAVTL